MLIWQPFLFLFVLSLLVGINALAVALALLLPLLLLVHHPHRLLMNPSCRWVLIIDLQGALSSTHCLAIALQPVQVIVLDRPVARIGWIELQHSIDRLACLLKPSHAAQSPHMAVPAVLAVGVQAYQLLCDLLQTIILAYRTQSMCH